MAMPIMMVMMIMIIGNYDSFVQTRSEKEEEQEKRYKAEQDQIKHMKTYVAKFGQGKLLLLLLLMLYINVVTVDASNQFKSTLNHIHYFQLTHYPGNAKMAKQAQSKEKVLDKMLKSGLTG